MAIAISNISALVERFANKILENQVNNAAPLVKELRREICDGGVYNLNLADNGNSSVVIHAGGGLPIAEGSNYNYQQIVVQPVNFYGRLKIPTDSAALMKGGKDSANLVRSQMEATSASLMRSLGRSVFDVDLGGAAAISISGAGTYTAGLVVTATVKDGAGFRVGQSVDIFETTDLFVANGAFKARIVLTTVGVMTTTGANSGQCQIIGTIQASATGVPAPAGGSPTLANVQFVMAGARDSSGFALVGGGFAGLIKAAGSGNLYNTSVTAAFDYTGNTDSSTTTVSNSSLQGLWQLSLQRSGYEPNAVVMNPLGKAGLLNQTLLVSQGASSAQGGGQRRFASGDVIDVFGKDSRISFNGVPVIADPNCPAKAIVMFREEDFMLAEYLRMGPLKDDKGSIMFNSQSALALDIQYLGMYNGIARKRNTVSAQTALTY